MPRLTSLLLAAIFALASLVALSCGGGDKNDVAATPTAKSVATAGETPHV
jgi:hypothetical protein